MDFFISDLHLGHKLMANIRNFQSIDAMDKFIINGWNLRIDSNDTVYMLGDFTLGGKSQAASYFRRLSGNKVVLNNHFHHDKKWIAEAKWNIPYKGFSIISQYFDKVTLVPPIYIYKVPNIKRKTIVLCHYPLAIWDKKHYAAWHLFGHNHKGFTPGGLSMNIAADSLDGYAPISLDEVVKTMSKKQEKLGITDGEFIGDE